MSSCHVYFFTNKYLKLKQFSSTALATTVVSLITANGEEGKQVVERMNPLMKKMRERMAWWVDVRERRKENDTQEGEELFCCHGDDLASRPAGSPAAPMFLHSDLLNVSTSGLIF